MKRYIFGAILGMVVAAGIQGAANADNLKPLTVGFSLDTKESSLETAWVDFLKSEGESQGKAAGLKIEWIINVANADPARQAANIDDLITRGVDIIMARAFDSGAIGTSSKLPKRQGFRSSLLTEAQPAANRQRMSEATAMIKRNKLGKRLLRS